MPNTPSTTFHNLNVVPPADMYTALANTRAAYSNPTVDQHYSWISHASNVELEARYKAHCWHI